jgi:uncharacterized protein
MNEGSDRRIDYVEFGARDLDEIRRFYGTAFGWSFQDYGPSYISFDDGRLTGGFTTATAAGRGGPLVILYAAELEQVQAAVAAAGGRIAQPIFSFPGGRRFHFLDPAGNELAVWSDR